MKLIDYDLNIIGKQYYLNDSILNSINNKYIKLSESEYNHLFNQFNIVLNTLTKYSNNLDIIRIDAIFDKNFNIKVNEINFNNPGMFSDIGFNDFLAKKLNLKYYNNFSNLFNELINKYDNLYIEECEHPNDILDNNFIKNISNINAKILKLNASHNDGVIFSLKHKFKYNLLLLDNYINKFCYKFENNIFLNELHKINDIFINTDIYDSSIKYNNKKIIKPNYSRLGKNITIIENNNIIFQNGDIEYNSVIQDYIDPFKYNNDIYTLSFFIVNNNISNMLFLNDKKNIGENSQFTPYLIN